MDRSLETLLHKLNGYHQLTKTTGCKMPCERIVYGLKEVFRANQKNVAQGVMTGEYTNSTLIVVRRQATFFVTKTTEVPSYTLGSFMADIGGSFGLFLGLSIWGVYEAAVGPAQKLLFMSAIKK